MDAPEPSAYSLTDTRGVYTPRMVSNRRIFATLPAGWRRLRVAVLLAHALVELAVAGMMWVAPAAFGLPTDPTTAALARSFGVGAGSVGLLSLLLLRWGRGTAAVAGFLTLAAYQAGIFVTQLISPMAGMPVWVAPVFHGAFVVAFAALAHRASSGADGAGLE